MGRAGDKAVCSAGGQKLAHAPDDSLMKLRWKAIKAEDRDGRTLHAHRSCRCIAIGCDQGGQSEIAQQHDLEGGPFKTANAPERLFGAV